MRRFLRKETNQNTADQDLVRQNAGESFSSSSTVTREVQLQEAKQINQVIARGMLSDVEGMTGQSAETLVRLSLQGEQIAKAHEKVRGIDENLAQSEKHIAGIESCFGNLFGGNKKKAAIKLETDLEFKVSWEKKPGTFEERTLRIGISEFSVVGKNNNLEGKWSYRIVHGIYIPEASLFKISIDKTCCTLKSPLYQTLVALLVKRAQCDIRFEDARLYFDPMKLTTRDYAVQMPISCIEAQEQTAQEVPEEDLDHLLNQTSAGLECLKRQGEAMTVELSRQQEKLDAFEGDVDNASERLRQDQRRVQRLS